MHQDDGLLLINEALRRAKQIGIAINVSVFDEGANLLSFQRMSDAPLGSIDIALKKGRSAVLFGAPTDSLGELVREQQLNSFEQTNGGLILFAGGEPILEAHRLIGGIGISGGSAAQDKEIALFAIHQFLASRNQNVSREKL